MSLTALSPDPRGSLADYDRTLGQLALLAATTESFGRHRLDHAISILHGAMMSGQFRLYADPRGRPAAALIWARLDAEMTEEYLENGRLPNLAAWTSGPDLWLLSIIAEGPALKPVLRDIRGPLFAGDARVHVLRPSPGGERRVVAFTREGVRLLRKLPPARDATPA
ncbi:toxin-activating lysine-acyltransferase [Roseivivax sp. GX 12232]|uniref:toxin-activating lysine-acyltransferase n=1 Tax=Roseivivax sp. GX 12232 TaxID=2900547 RepID=UPI001E328C80|nr:toxin-activating lysine-acyltransferase [Roseivivax sp. GX 12232]MCE0506688.1 toxin-activating lysine-acyltransferase [Roseivivax sp. GX 12232]